MSRPLTGLLAMPGPRDPDAPWFHGDDLDLLPFLDDFEDLADSCGLTDDLKCCHITHYTEPLAKCLWTALLSYKSRDYQAFREEIISFYPRSARIEARRRQADEVERLHQCIHALTTNDPAYATLWLHLNSLSPTVAKLCPPPTPVSLQPRYCSSVTDTDPPQQDDGAPLFHELEESEPTTEIDEVEEVELQQDIEVKEDGQLGVQPEVETCRHGTSPDPPTVLVTSLPDPLPPSDDFCPLPVNPIIAHAPLECSDPADLSDNADVQPKSGEHPTHDSHPQPSAPSLCLTPATPAFTIPLTSCRNSHFQLSTWLTRIPYTIREGIAPGSAQSQR